MRYLKSAALLLLTASSLTTLLSAAAKAEPNSQDSDTEERIDSSLIANSTVNAQTAEVDAPVPSTMAAISQGNEFDSNSIMTPIVDEMRSPRFDLLRARLLSDTVQPSPAEITDPLAATEHTEAEQTETVEPIATMENVVAVEVIDNTKLPVIESQPEAFIEAPKMTLESFRELVEEADKAQGMSDAENASADRSEDIVQIDIARLIVPPAVQLAQTENDSSLPVLEESDTPAAEPAADPESNPAEETVPAEEEVEALDVDPPGTPATESESEAADPEVTTPTEGAAQIEGLPNTLFSDPNPLSFPTQESEVDVDQNPVVTLEQAVALAYQNNQTLQASLLSLEQAEAGVRAARAANRPTVGAGANLTTTENDGSRTTLGGTVEVEYDILTGGTRAATIRVAELQQEVSSLTVEAQREQIRLATANAYYQLQDAGEQIRINQSFLDEAARNLRDAQLRQEVGVGTRFDTLRAEVQFANARQSLIQAQGSQRIARRDISRLLNLPPTSGLTATPVAVGDTWPLTLEESILKAFQNRAELEQQLLQADISEQQRRQALAAVRPQVSVFANYSPQFILDGATAFEDDFQDSVSFGARFNWQFYDGGAARARARQQEIGSAIAEEQFSETLDQVRFDVEQAYFNLETNQENILTSQVAVAQAEEALALANLRLQAGVGTQLDVLTAQSELTQAQGNNVAAILGYNRALVAIERAISNVVTPF